MLMRKEVEATDVSYTKRVGNTHHHLVLQGGLRRLEEVVMRRYIIRIPPQPKGRADTRSLMVGSTRLFVRPEYRDLFTVCHNISGNLLLDVPIVHGADLALNDFVAKLLKVSDCSI